MTRLAFCLATVWVMAGCAQQSFTTPNLKEPARQDVVVQFGNASVDPSGAKLKAGGAVTWNNTSDYMAVVRFPKVDKTKFTCRAVLRPDWQYTADNLESIPTGGASERIVFPCALKPGTYPYTISLFGNIADMDNPAFTLSASLIVE